MEMFTSNDRLHWRKNALITSFLRTLAKNEVKGKNLTAFSPKNPCNVKVKVFSPTKRRLDPPNVYPTVKALLDGFTDGGLWTDDNHEVIRSTSFEYGGISGTKKFRLEIEIERIE